MDNHNLFFFRESDVMPTPELLARALGSGYAAYEALQDALPDLEIEQLWQWYTPYKAWFARGQHWWTTARGTRKEKTLYWLYVYEQYFSVAVWFKEKNRDALLNADISAKTRQLIRDAETMGKVPTFPVVIDVSTNESLPDIYALLDYKKKLEK